MSTVVAYRSQSVGIIYDHCVFLISTINTLIKETVNYCVYIKCRWFTLDRFSDGTMIKCTFNEYSWKAHECFRIVSLEHDGVKTKKKWITKMLEFMSIGVGNLFECIPDANNIFVLGNAIINNDSCRTFPILNSYFSSACVHRAHCNVFLFFIFTCELVMYAKRNNTQGESMFVPSQRYFSMAYELEQTEIIQTLDAFIFHICGSRVSWTE